MCKKLVSCINLPPIANIPERSGYDGCARGEKNKRNTQRIEPEYNGVNCVHFSLCLYLLRFPELHILTNEVLERPVALAQTQVSSRQNT